MAKLLLIFSCLFLAVNASPLKETRIVDGHVAHPGQFPYMASLTDSSGHRCGGSVIDENWVLTAAHCVDFYKSPKEVWVYVGMNDLDKSGDRYDVQKIIVHKDWNIININSDIAMLKLLKSIKFNDRVQKINLATSEVGHGNPAILSGWGITEYPSDIASNELKFLNLNIVAYNKCLMDLFPNQVHGSNICAKPVTTGGACSGDSGSPLVHDNTVAGIASWVMPCGIGYPDVYTKVSFFHNWIMTNINTK